MPAVIFSQALILEKIAILGQSPRRPDESHQKFFPGS